MKMSCIVIFLCMVTNIPFLFSQSSPSDTTDPDFGIIAPEYGSPIFRLGTRDDTGAAFVLSQFREEARIPDYEISRTEQGFGFFPRMEGDAINPRLENKYIEVKALVDNSEGSFDLQSDSQAGFDREKKNWWAFMLVKRSDPKSGIIPTEIWFAEPGPYNNKKENPFLVVRPGETLLLNIIWVVPSDLDPQDMAVQYVDVRGFYSNFIRLDRVSR